MSQDTPKDDLSNAGRKALQESCKDDDGDDHQADLALHPMVQEALAFSEQHEKNHMLRPPTRKLLADPTGMKKDASSSSSSWLASQANDCQLKTPKAGTKGKVMVVGSPTPATPGKAKEGRHVKNVFSPTRTIKSFKTTNETDNNNKDDEDRGQWTQNVLSPAGGAARAVVASFRTKKENNKDHEGHWVKNIVSPTKKKTKSVTSTSLNADDDDQNRWVKNLVSPTGKKKKAHAHDNDKRWVKNGPFPNSSSAAAASLNDNNNNSSNNNETDDDDDEDKMMMAAGKKTRRQSPRLGKPGCDLHQVGAIRMGPTGHDFSDSDDDDSVGQDSILTDSAAAAAAKKTVIVSCDNGGKLTTTDVEKGSVPGWTGDDNDLAVAVTVDEDDENDGHHHRPAAIQYDPDAKPPPIATHHRLKIYLGFAVLVLVVLVVLGAALIPILLMQQQEQDGKEEESGMSKRDKLGIQERIEAVIGSEQLEDAQSPYARALDWIKYDDPLQLLPDQPDFLQRYLAAYFYFATSVQGHSWAACGPATEQDPNEACNLRVIITPDPMDFREIASNRWLSGMHVCYWAGIGCDSQMQVREIELGANNLTGTFPEGVQYLTYLQKLQMEYGGLYGSLPAGELIAMKHLDDLQLSMNSFSGSIPSELWQARNLRKMDFSRNDLTGSVPTEIGSAGDIKAVHFFENRLTGIVPTELGQCPSLSLLRLQGNQLTGSIPTEIGGMDGLYEMWIDNNQLSGSIPTEIGLLSRLDDIRIHDNSISGDIPEELWNLDLIRVDMNNCNLTGTLSEKIGTRTNLTVLRLSNNQFSGTIPENLGRLNATSLIWLNGNDLTGNMPESVCEQRGDTQLVQLQADCLPDAETQFVQVDCDNSCCTLCCDPDGKRCME